MTIATTVSPLRRALTGLLAALVAIGPGPATGAQAPQSAAPTFAVDTSLVVLDAVVRDKKGRAVKDLAAADFEVYEDGVRQTIESLRLVDRTAEEPGLEPEPALGSAPAAPAPMAPSARPVSPATASAGTPAGPALIALVFDRMSSPDARRTAHKAARAYADGGHVAGDYVAVFTIDLALKTLQPFTRDIEHVRASLLQAANQANTQFASTRDEARDKASSSERSAQALDALTSSGGADSSAQVAAAGLSVQVAFADIETRMARTFDSLERDQQGFASTNGLLAIVNSLKRVPGRKTIVFFSEGLAITTNVQAKFRSVIASANRSNVSIYTVDAGGLRLDSGSKEARDEVTQTVTRRLRQEERGVVTGGPLTQAMERNEDNLRLNPHAGLGELASQTGGFLVRDTNDAGRAFKQIEEDMRFHYVLTYSPTDARFDGRFRSITLKVLRPGVEAQTRKGYLAVRPDTSLPVRDYEAQALGQFELDPRPTAFPMELGALSFPEARRAGRVSVLVKIPGSAVSYVAGTTPNEREADFTIVARFKNERGLEVDRVSQQYQLSATTEKLELAQRGSVLFFKEADLPPGRFAVEAVTYDAKTQKGSVRTETIDVPAAGSSARLSSLLLLRQAEQLAEAEQKRDNPMIYGGMMLYPSLGAPFKKSATPALNFFYTVYAESGSLPRQAQIEVLKGERVLAKAPADLAPGDSSTRAQQAGSIPLQSLTPGTYALRVTIGDGADAVSRQASFEVVD